MVGGGWLVVVDGWWLLPCLGGFCVHSGPEPAAAGAGEDGLLDLLEDPAKESEAQGMENGGSPVDENNIY